MLRASLCLLLALEEFCNKMHKLEIKNNSRVVLCDFSFTAWTASIWRILRWIAFDNATAIQEGEIPLKLRKNAIFNQDKIRNVYSTINRRLVDTLFSKSYTHGGVKTKRHVTYCGNGFLVSVIAFTSLHLGYRNVGFYAASLQEWVEVKSSPMQTETY